MKEIEAIEAKGNRNLLLRVRAASGVVPVISRALIAAAVLLGSATAASAAPGVIKAVGVENEYADVISQIGGQYVHVTAIETDPNTDPHTFEVSPKVAGQIAAADLVIKNGIGYDAWADKIIAAAPNGKRKVIDVQHLLGLPDSTRNPHLWYDPKTMPAVAKAIVADLSALNPARASYFQANGTKFEASLKPWLDAIEAFRAHHPGTPLAVTEPVADYMLEAAGADIQTPYSMQAAIMNGTDPSPQDVTKQNALFADHKVKVFVYNQQVTDALTQSFLAQARKNGIPVVGVYETMPTPGFTYQSWMLAEVNALDRAMTGKVSTEVLRSGK
ncbi:metal ABC transporter solute-binding protein, Zn/Mn family [Burkholderia multivorans]|uniref:Cation ABC transporter substrate-binding protein n=1 Tax=Burkholderia multivorans TaxID=87883 RepID=A0AB37AQ07_9BURK|nr:zinc ABC transporter substrate-binding protein [Burkholderia multivorans]PRE45454.1 cation ABC transporter substrate-binding protein [Burkholderia multivorans]PRE52142.1 cation ABC transporter substrate-binding protein [Burkholderia multivorans]